MNWRSIFLTLAVLILTASVMAPASVLADDKITAIRGKTLFLYKSPKGKDVEKMAVKAVPLPLAIGEEGEKNGRYQVLLGAEEKKKVYWIKKAQVKESTLGKNSITANCQDTTKSYASSRGLGNCE